MCHFFHYQGYNVYFKELTSVYLASSYTWAATDVQRNLDYGSSPQKVHNPVNLLKAMRGREKVAALTLGLQRERSLKARVVRQRLTGRTMPSAQQEMHRVWIKTEEGVISEQREEKH